MYRTEQNTALHVHDYGFQICDPGHDHGPAVREYYLFHYVFSGCGLFRVDGKTYSLREGEGFLIFPKILTYYQADHNNPWTYGWIGMTGFHAKQYLTDCGLSRENPIWRGEKDSALESYMEGINLDGTAAVNHPRITGFTYLFLARMIEKSTLNQISPKNRQETYLRSAIDYMEKNYYNRLTIGMVSRHVGLDRSYLGALFKKRLNTTMQDYLITLRMKKACILLENEDIRISDVARSVGYLDPLQFSKIFTQRKGICPLEYKKNRTEK